MTGSRVKLTFGNTLPTGVSAGNTDEAVVTITDDDVPSVWSVSFEQGSYSVDEGDSLVTVNSHPERADPERTVTIPITTADQDGRDYSGVGQRHLRCRDGADLQLHRHDSLKRRRRES